MLRECHRVLKPGGRLAGYVIHTPAGLSPDQEARAAELGPSHVIAPAPPDELVRASGLSEVAQTDVTEAFRVTCHALHRAREEMTEQLRAEEGDEVYEDELAKQRGMLTGIHQGVLRRSLTVAVRR